MDHTHASIAAGLPFTFKECEVPRDLEALRSPADLG